MNDNEKLKTKKIFSTSEVILLVAMSLIIGLSIGNLLDHSSTMTNSSISSNKYINEFISNYNYIVDNYYDEIDEEELISSAISGMMNSLGDPYSTYLDSNESNNFSINLEGSYSGLGIQITKDEETGHMQIVSIFQNSPADLADLYPGDMIIKLDDKESKDMTSSEFSNLVKNSTNTIFKLTILRDGQEQIIEVNKKNVVINSVTSKLYEENNKKIGYIYIGIFANNTYSQFSTALEELEKENLNSLIIDVRGNTGGHLTAVNDILDLFLNSKQIMYQFNQNGKITKIYGTGKENKNYEIVLLGDSSSASASEVLIAGIKENLNSKFIGEKTYGKGTVQEMVDLPNGTKYKITVKKWLTPNGNWVNDTEGIIPDIELSLDFKYYETLEDKDDNQLQAAIDYLK